MTVRVGVVNVELGGHPLDCGGKLGTALLPVLRATLGDLAPADRVLWWAGFFGAVGGATAADITPEKAAEVLRVLADQFVHLQAATGRLN